MHDTDRWKWFAFFASVLPWLLFMFETHSIAYVLWVLISPLWTLIIVCCTIEIYETFRGKIE